VRNKQAAAKQFENSSFRAKLEFLEGDLSRPSMGMKGVDWSSHKDAITEIWHCAANLSFSSRLGQEVMKCNLEGTQVILAKAWQCGRLKRFYYISTAFVHGNGSGVIKEDGLLPRNSISFHNTYEESKYLAEKEVRRSHIPFCIFRPAIIMGHSITGEAGSRVTYFGFYKALKKAFTNGRHIPLPGETLRMEGINGFRNHICVDHAASMMNDIARSGKEAGKTFHLAYGVQGSVAEIFSAINRCLGSNFVIDGKRKTNSRNLTEVLARKYSSDYYPYIMRNDPQLDRRNTLSLLERDIALPEPLDEFLYKMYRAQSSISA
jgi:thioester reductase-like protein